MVQARNKPRVMLALDIYLHQVHRGVVEFAQQAGWMLDANMQRRRELTEDWSADGILAFISSGDELGPTLRASKLPMVNMSPWQPELRLPTVMLDNHAGGALAAEHLIGRGFQHLAMVQFNASSPTSTGRRMGFEETALGAERQFHPLVSPYRSESNAFKRQIDWLNMEISRLPKPVGGFTEGDLWAVELIHICQQAGLAVPEQVGIIGVDNDPLVVDVAPVALTSVDNNLHGLGFRAAQLLDDLMAGILPPGQPILVPPIGIVQRQSTNVLAVDDEDLLAATRFIHSHFSEPITVEEVTDQTAVSRRKLQLLFSRYLGRTIANEIKRCRLDLAKRLLTETGLKIDVIAERAGFGNAVQMTKVFTRELGTGPARYRQAHNSR